jgi:pimeloyl-ACP methyl ester carboxylesterase
MLLRGWYSVPAHENGKAIILLHGISDNRLGVAGYGQMFLQHGYRILLPDSRAHGGSGGVTATYGLRESDDIHRWVSWLYDHGATRVDGFGESMGAALVLESMRLEPRFCAVVADSPFATFRSIAYDREGFFVGAGGLGLEPLVGRTIGLLPAEIALRYARWRYDIDLLQANPLDAVRSSRILVCSFTVRTTLTFCRGTRAFSSHRTPPMLSFGLCRAPGMAERHQLRLRSSGGECSASWLSMITCRTLKENWRIPPVKKQIPRRCTPRKDKAGMNRCSEERGCASFN